MRLPKIQFRLKDIERCLFENAPPEVSVFPFFHSKIQKLSLMEFHIRMDSRVFNTIELPSYKKLAKIIVDINKTSISEAKLEDFFRDSNSPMVNMVFLSSTKAFLIWKNYFLKNISEFIKEGASKYQWTIANSIGISAIMDAPFTTEQKMWIAFASSFSKREEHQFFVDIADSLHPWLDKELYFEMKRVGESKKENVKYEEDKEKMLRGSFGLPDSDTKVIKQLEHRIATDEDLDIIR